MTYKPADYVLDEWLHDIGVNVPFESAQQLLSELRDSFRQEDYKDGEED